MKRRKIICPEERLKQLEDNFVKETQEWEYIHEYGCQDPFWPDGTNLNLIRNHCIYFIEQIKKTIIIWLLMAGFQIGCWIGSANILTSRRSRFRCA